MTDELFGSISFVGIHLMPDDLSSLAKILRNCRRFKILELINCHLDSSCVQALASGLRGSDVEFDVLDVSFNRNLRADSLQYLYEICQHTQGLNYWQCGFKQIDLLTFNPEIPEIPETELRTEKDAILNDFVKHNTLELNLHNVTNQSSYLEELICTHQGEGQKLSAVLSGFKSDPELQTACAILQRCDELCSLSICENSLTNHDLVLIKKSLNRVKLKSLNIFLNESIMPGGWSILGEIAKQCNISSLFMTCCNLTKSNIEDLLKSLEGMKIHRLDVSRNANMDRKTLAALGRLIQECHVVELVMGYCKLFSDGLKFFQEGVGNAKLKKLDISGNDQISSEGFAVLGEIVKTSSVEELDVSECDPRPCHIHSFRSTVGNAKIVKLNVSRNRNMQGDGLEEVGKMVSQCQLEELFIRQCGLKEETLKRFHSGLGKSQIPCLDLGFYFMKDRISTKTEVEVVGNLLKNVSVQLTLNKWKFDKAEREYMQTMINQSTPSLRVVLDRSNNEVLKSKTSG